MLATPYYRFPPSKLVAVMALVVGILLLARSMGLYPIVFADEYVYSKLARLTSLKEANVPGYLYFLIYRLTNACGDQYLGCTRILNSIFFVSAAPFIFSICRKIADEPTSLLVTALSILSPINTYTAYFMPESLYFLSFWVFAFALFNIRNNQTIYYWAFLGILFGVSALVKPHAIFLTPALVIYFFVLQKRRINETPLRRLFIEFALFFIAAIVTKLAVGFGAAGVAGITIFGSGYTSYASDPLSDPGRYLTLLKLAFENAQGHMLALSTLFGVAITTLLLPLTQLSKNDREFPLQKDILFFTLLVFSSLLAVVALFTASVAGHGPYESNSRLHMRYYNFALPLFLLIVAPQASDRATVSTLGRRAIVGLPIMMVILYSAYTQFSPYMPSIVDGPELRGFTFSSNVFYILAALSFSSVALWTYSTGSGAKVFLYLFMPVAVAFSTFFVNQQLRQRLLPDVFDKAGIFTKQYLGHEEISKVVVVGSDLGGLFRSLFYLDNSHATLEAIPRGATYDPATLAEGKEWVLIIGDHALPGDEYFEIPMSGFTLARVRELNIVDFRKASWPGVLARTRGLSSAESWGTWSSSAEVRLEFSTALPRKFTMHLTGHAFGPNVDRDFIAAVGHQKFKFSLGATSEARVFQIDNPSREKVVKIIVPSPTSPKELGISKDDRSLGIGLTRLEITPL